MDGQQVSLIDLGVTLCAQTNCAQTLLPHVLNSKKMMSKVNKPYQ